MVLIPRSIDERVRRYIVFQVLWSFELWWPFWTLWLLAAPGVGYFEATLVDIVFWIVSLFAAMPAGALADRLGRRPALVAGIVTWHLGVILFGLAPSLPFFALANATWAVGASFLFSVGPAFLYDTLVEAGEEARYPRVISRVAFFGFLSSAGGSALGGLVVQATGSFQTVLLLSAVNGVLATATVLTFREPAVRRSEALGMVAQIRTGLRATRRTPQIVLLILFQILTGIVLYILTFFRAPLIESLVGADYGLFGVVFGGFFVVAAFAGVSVGRILERIGESGALLLTYLLVFPPFAIIYFATAGGLPASIAIAFAILAQIPSYIIWGLESPVVTTIINRRVGSAERSTVLSISVFLTTLSLAIVEPLIGWLATTTSLAIGLTTLAAVATIPAAYALLAFRRIGLSLEPSRVGSLPGRSR